MLIGLESMKESMGPLKDTPWFQELLTNFSNPILCVVIGLIFTVIIQSASASVGVLQTLAVAGVMTSFPQMFYLMLGMNIGASVAPLLASIGGRKDAKRVAIIVALFESIGMVLFVIVTQVFPGVFDLIQGTASDPSRQIANANSIFNIRHSDRVAAMCQVSGETFQVDRTWRGYQRSGVFALY